MSWWLVGTFVLSVVATAASFQELREWAAARLPGPDDLIDRWSAPALATAVTLSLAAGWCAPRTPITTTPPAATIPVRVVGDNERNAKEPVPHAAITIAGDTLTADDNGLIAVPVASIKGDASFRVAANLYLTRFLRADDPVFVRGGEIRLERRMRVVVIHSTAANTAAAGDRRGVAIRQGIEERLTRSGVELVADDNQRNDIEHRLYQYAEGRALYDPQTLLRAGDFHGASHGLFWDVSTSGASPELTMRLVSLRTTEVESTIDSPMIAEHELSDVRRETDRLISRIARADILSPRTTSLCGRRITPEGSGIYLPEGWTLWLSIQPDGNALHFPQFRLTVRADTGWVGSDVYLGEIAHELPARFRAYLLLADADYTSQISGYLGEGGNGGIDVNAWQHDRVRILGEVSLTRVAAMTAGCQKT